MSSRRSEAQVRAFSLQRRHPAHLVRRLPVTGGHGVNKDEIWFSLLGDWFEKFVQPETSDRIGYVKVNGAVPGEYIASNTTTRLILPTLSFCFSATGSDYFSFCSSLHIPHNSSLILVELSINDEYLPAEHTANMENLLRGLLELPSQPAVILMQALEFNSARMANGGDVHLPVAVYYGGFMISGPLFWIAEHALLIPDIPVIRYVVEALKCGVKI